MKKTFFSSLAALIVFIAIMTVLGYLININDSVDQVVPLTITLVTLMATSVFTTLIFWMMTNSSAAYCAWTMLNGATATLIFTTAKKFGTSGLITLPIIAGLCIAAIAICLIHRSAVAIFKDVKDTSPNDRQARQMTAGILIMMYGGMVLSGVAFYKIIF
jgi:hypothetical protein